MGVQLKTLVTRPVPLVDGNTAPAGQLTHDNVRVSGGVSGSEALTLNERLDPSIAILPVGAVRLGGVSWATGGRRRRGLGGGSPLVSGARAGSLAAARPSPSTIL